MATQTKQCNQCNKSKPITEFYKRKASKDGLQLKCKACCKVVNENFREANPGYQLDWQRNNHSKWLSYIAKWAKKNVTADDSRSKIYYIINPEQSVYVGRTQTAFSARKTAHKVQYKGKGRRLPLLHRSFDLYGWDNHKWVIIDMAGTDRETLKSIESAMINHFKQIGMSLNVRLK